MTISPLAALHQLRELYQQAHHCAPPSDDHVREWARNPLQWATQQVRYRGWDYPAAEAVVRTCRRLHPRLQGLATQQEPLES